MPDDRAFTVPKNQTSSHARSRALPHLLQKLLPLIMPGKLRTGHQKVHHFGKLRIARGFHLALPARRIHRPRSCPEDRAKGSAVGLRQGRKKPPDQRFRPGDSRRTPLPQQPDQFGNSLLLTIGVLFQIQLKAVVILHGNQAEGFASLLRPQLDLWIFQPIDRQIDIQVDAAGQIPFEISQQRPQVIALSTFVQHGVFFLSFNRARLWIPRISYFPYGAAWLPRKAPIQNPPDSSNRIDLPAVFPNYVPD